MQGGHQPVSLLPGEGEQPGREWGAGRAGGLGDFQITLPAGLLISKVAVIRSSCWGCRWEGVKSYARSYKQCVPINQIKAERVYFQKVCFLRRARDKELLGEEGKEREGKRGRAGGGERMLWLALAGPGGASSWCQVGLCQLPESSHSIPSVAAPWGRMRGPGPPQGSAIRAPAGNWDGAAPCLPGAPEHEPVSHKPLSKLL